MDSTQFQLRRRKHKLLMAAFLQWQVLSIQSFDFQLSASILFTSWPWQEQSPDYHNTCFDALLELQSPTMPCVTVGMWLLWFTSVARYASFEFWQNSDNSCMCNIGAYVIVLFRKHKRINATFFLSSGTYE